MQTKKREKVKTFYDFGFQLLSEMHKGTKDLKRGIIMILCFFWEVTIRRMKMMMVSQLLFQNHVVLTSSHTGKGEDK